MAMNVLVTGGAGAIGGNLVHELLKHTEVSTIVAVDNLSSGYLENVPSDPKLHFIQGDIADMEVLEMVFSKPIDLVFHLAANFANQNSVEFPDRDLQTNGAGTLRLLEKAHAYKVKRFIYTSSSCVYGAQTGVLEESMQANTLDTPYAITKLLGEQYVRFFYEYHGLPAAIVRLFNTYGAGERPGKYRNVIPNFFYQALNGQPLQITGTGQETRDFNFIDDTVRGIILAAWREGIEGMIFNIASGVEMSILEIAQRINQLTSNPAGVLLKGRRKWDRVFHRRASINRARQFLGYEPTVSLHEGLRRTGEWFKTTELKECSR